MAYVNARVNNGAAARNTAAASAVGRVDGQLVRDRDDEAEGQRPREVRTVRADRLRDELTDRAALGGKCLRRRLVPRLPRGGHEAERYSASTASRRGQCRVERLEPAEDHPAGAVPLAEVVRDRAHLDRRDPRERARAQDAEPLHRLDPELVPGLPARDRRARGDRERDRLRELVLERRQERAVRLHAVDDRDLRHDVAVHRLRPEDERARDELPPAGDADVEDRPGRVDREPPRRRRRRLDRPDPAHEPLVPAQLELGRRDQEQVGRHVGRSLNTGCRAASASHSSCDESRRTSKNGRVTRPSS